VREVGAGGDRRDGGDHVVLLYTPRSRLQVVPQPQDEPLHGDPRDAGQGLMPDGTEPLLEERKSSPPLMGCSTFSNFTVLPEIAVAKVRKDARSTRSVRSAAGVTTASAR